MATNPQMIGIAIGTVGAGSAATRLIMDDEHKAAHTGGFLLRLAALGLNIKLSTLNSKLDDAMPSVAPNSGPAALADEAARIMDNAARSRGLNPNSGIVNMAIPRSKILEKIAGKPKGSDYHLDEHIPELIGKADKGLVEYWRKEVHRLIDEMEGWGGRLSKNDDVFSRAAEYRRRLEEILNNRLRDLEN